MADAMELAEGIQAFLAPHCDRCEIAGSIRRRKPEVKDVELVVIPKREPSGLLGEPVRSEVFIQAVETWEKIKGEATGRYTQRRLEWGRVLDLFIVTPETYGLQLAIRTGSARFSREVLAKGWVRAG